MLIFHITPCTPIGQYNHTNYCIEIKTQTSFFNPNSSITSLLSSITLCRSQNLYLRTSLGLFQVSSVDFDARLLTISHPCSSSDQSPILITKKKLAAKVSVRACIVCWIVKNVMLSTVLVAQKNNLDFSSTVFFDEEALFNITGLLDRMAESLGLFPLLPSVDDHDAYCTDFNLWTD